jgi:hypothetical protein
MWEAQQTACSALSQTQCPFWSIFMTMDDVLANTSDVTQAIQVFFLPTNCTKENIQNHESVQ